MDPPFRKSWITIGEHDQLDNGPLTIDSDQTLPMPSKQQIRDVMLQKRLGLVEEKAVKYSTVIQETIIASSQFQSARKIAVYQPIRNEVATDRLNAAAVQAGKEIYYPHWQPATSTISFFRVEALAELEKKPWGTMEPKPDTSREILPNHLDLMLVPGLAFDYQCFRLGYGFGGYDRVLAGNATEAWGLAYDMQVVDSLPVEPHDVSCFRVITEKRQISKA